ncbi:MAG: S-methyl-5-thioribose-1-phosphate isomerase [Candidatus Hydrogenedens sp.]|nr:S-methyl-5-thioribose-1-phosphate isomerase [Candidatus Hydrogenedens sp.]
MPSFLPVLWKDQRLFILDQTLLPLEKIMVELDNAQAVWDAIKSLQVRGAPAIGVCAAYGMIVGIREQDPGDDSAFRAAAAKVKIFLATSRPTAVNLFYALDRMEACLNQCGESTPQQLFDLLEKEATAIFDEDVAMCRAIGAHGASLIDEGMGILTHCNAGGLATSGYGTALAPLYTAHEQGRRFRVYADETRPLLQGARLTAWELMESGIDVTLLCDNMAAMLLASGKVDIVIVGADRIAANGDTANKIGTYGVALLAKHHGIPFYVAAPASTFDAQTATGADIPIEERDADEVRCHGGKLLAPPQVKVYNPAFDVTPMELITGFITDQGILSGARE